MSLAKPTPRERAKPKRPRTKCAICDHSLAKHADGFCSVRVALGPMNGPSGLCGCLDFKFKMPPPAAVKALRRSPIQRASAPIKKVMPRCKCGHKERTHYLDGVATSCRRCTCAKYQAKRIPANKKPRGMRESDLGRAKRTLWKRFAAYVKARDGNACFTCDAVVTGGDLQAGHMFPGRTGALLYDPLVVFSQCSDCNRGKRGNTPVFVRRYVERFGIEQFQAAVARTSREKQWRTHEVRELIAALRRGGADYEALYMERHGL